MKFLFFALLLVVYNQARITIPIEKVRVERPVSNGMSEAADSGSSLRLGKSSDSMKLTLWNKRNFLHFGNIYVGSNNQTMKVLFDTGSNDLWLSTPSCYGCPSGVKGFDCSSSTTCTKTTAKNSITYASGYIEGYKGSDMIGLTPDFKTMSPILLASSGTANDDLIPAAGIIGLGSMNSANDFIDLAYKDGLIEDKVFAFYMDYNGDSTGRTLTNQTYMTLGYVPEDKINNMAWIPVTDSSYWASDILGIKIGDTVLSSLATSGSILIDTGSSVNSFSTEVQNEFMAQMKKFSYTTYYGINWWPCQKDDLAKYPNISLSVNGLRIDVTPRSLFDFPTSRILNGSPHCQLILSSPSFGISILGDAFLQENFVAFSKRNQTMGIHLAAGHQILPNPNPPMFVVLIQIVLMLVVGVILFVNEKKRLLTKTALGDQYTVAPQESFGQKL